MHITLNYFHYIAIWSIVLVPIIIAGVIIVRRKHERRTFRALGFTITALPALWLACLIMLYFFTVGASVGSGDSLGQMEAHTSYISKPIAAP